MFRKLRISKLFEFMQEAAIHHTEALGAGRAKTLDRGFLWVVTMQHAEISRLPEYDEKAVKEAKEKKTMNEMKHEHHEGGCPGSRMAQFDRSEEAPVTVGRSVSRLAQWPCQIKLLPTQAPFFDGAKLLIAADCTAYAYANMHEDFMKGKITVIGCPKLDAVDYTEKLTAIIRDNDIKSVTIVRMEVPCCGGLQRAAENALKASDKFIPWQVVTISRDGRILD